MISPFFFQKMQNQCLLASIPQKKKNIILWKRIIIIVFLGVSDVFLIPLKLKKKKEQRTEAKTSLAASLLRWGLSLNSSIWWSEIKKKEKNFLILWHNVSYVS